MAKKTLEEKAAAKAAKEAKKTGQMAASAEDVPSSQPNPPASDMKDEVPGEGTVHKPELRGMTREEAKGARFERPGVNNQSRKIEE